MAYNFDASQFIRRDFANNIMKLATNAADGGPWSLVSMGDDGDEITMVFETSHPMRSAGPNHRDDAKVKQATVHIRADAVIDDE